MIQSGEISMDDPRRFFRIETVSLAALLILLAAGNFLWLRENKTPPSWDQSAHVSYCLDFHDLFQGQPAAEGDGRGFRGRLLTTSTYWPPFFHLSTVPLTLLFGFSPNTVTATHIFYLVLLAFSVYVIGRHFLTPGLGAAAAALTLFYPIIFGLSRTQLIDLPLTAMVSLVQALILKTGAGTRWRKAWMLGLAAGLCLLTKWTGPVFFGATFLLVFFPSWKKKEASRTSMVLSILSMAGFAALVSVPWFLENWTEFSRRMGAINTADAIRLGSPKPFSPQAFLWYGKEIVQSLLTWPLLPFLILSAANGFFRARLKELLHVAESS